MNRRLVAIILAGLVVVALCASASIYAPSLVEIVKRMHGG